MYENIAGLSIQGEFFVDNAKLRFFTIQDQRIAIVFGRNGSGKSTLARGFAQCATGTSTATLSASLLKSDGSVLCVFPEKCDNLFVFDETYIDDNIKIDSDGLGTIVLLGEQVDADKKIKELEANLDTKRPELVQLVEKTKDYADQKNILSPQYYYSKIEKALKAPSGWAETDSKIKGHKKNSNVTDSIIVEIGKLTTAKTLEQLKDEFSETSILLSKISDSAISFPEEIKTVDFSEDDENVIISLLSLEIEKPELTDREKEILAAVEKGMQAQLESAREVFKEDNVGICPYCYQKVDKSYKQEFVASIDKVLNHDVDVHIEALKRAKLPVIVFDKQKYASLDAALSTDIEKKIIMCNQDIDEYKKLIIKKTENTYTPISRKASLSNLIRELNVLLTRLEKARKGYLDASKRKKALSDKLLETNKLIASKSISDDYGTYIKQQKTHDTLKANILQKEQEIKNIMEKIKQQNEVKWKTGIAIQKINKALEYIFFSKDRLSIELKNDLYYLKSNDKDVKPRDISSGERNIIALCYFFIEIAANQEADKLYHKEQLLVIDDPVSSFDFENRVGILSYLKSQMKSVIFGDSNSKIILMSHDLTTIFDLQKAADEIQKATKVNDQLADANWGWQELYDKKLIQFAKKRNEYSALLSLVYSYAHDKSGADSLNIGNYMRRTMEAFSTFSYKKSIEDLSCDADVIGMLGEKSDFFEHLMYRLVLHGESHSEERVKSLHSDNNFFDFISDDEKQKTARRILCLMYSLNPQHIQAHIEHAINDIKKWCEEIPVNDGHDAQEQIVHREAISLRTIRLYGRVSAGVGIESIYDMPFAEHETTNDWGDYALEIDGDSMEPDLPNGSIVLVKACEELPEGAIGIFLYDGKLYCKTRKYIDGETYLFSKNPIYQPIHIDSEKQGKIQGQVLGIDE